MSVQIKTFRIADQAGESELNGFLQNKRVQHWQAQYDNGSWQVFVAYDQERAKHNQTDHRPKEKKEPKMEHTPDLPAELLPLYDDIRKWRNQRAREEKVKPYVLFNNKQLEDLVKNKPSDLDTLKPYVADMSSEYFEKYGNELLGALHSGS
jgi:superfamily II DNA helicase RecQ